MNYIFLIVFIQVISLPISNQKKALPATKCQNYFQYCESITGYGGDRKLTAKEFFECKYRNYAYMKVPPVQSRSYEDFIQSNKRFCESDYISQEYFDYEIKVSDFQIELKQLGYCIRFMDDEDFSVLMTCLSYREPKNMILMNFKACIEDYIYNLNSRHHFNKCVHQFRANIKVYIQFETDFFDVTPYQIREDTTSTNAKFNIPDSRTYKAILWSLEGINAKPYSNNDDIGQMYKSYFRDHDVHKKVTEEGIKECMDKIMNVPESHYNKIMKDVNTNYTQTELYSKSTQDKDYLDYLILARAYNRFLPLTRSLWIVDFYEFDFYISNQETNKQLILKNEYHENKPLDIPPRVDLSKRQRYTQTASNTSNPSEISESSKSSEKPKQSKIKKVINYLNK